MIKRLKAFVNWLESRFPEKLVVTADNYQALCYDVRIAGQEITTWIGEVATLRSRVDALERAAVHKEAVQDLITVVKALKDDVTAMKANIGWDIKAAKQEEISAMLNGEAI